MWLEQLHLVGYRNYVDAIFTPSPSGITVCAGLNGAGKTNIVEAIAWFTLGRSFRGSPTEALVNNLPLNGEPRERAQIKAAVRESANRANATELEADLPKSGRARLRVNGQGTQSNRVSSEVFRVTIFSPVDLELLKGGPSQRRDYLDDALVMLHPVAADLLRTYERTLKQRNAFLSQLGGRIRKDDEFTLDVWDERLGEAGDALGDARINVLNEIAPKIAISYGNLGGGNALVDITYDAPWRTDGLQTQLAKTRQDCVRRGLTTVGPHRDELTFSLDGLVARTHASQGQQRTLALAMRFGVHELSTEQVGTPPVLLLDDVFSELDPHHCEALLTALPMGQCVLTTASPLPSQVRPEQVVLVDQGFLQPAVARNSETA